MRLHRLELEGFGPFLQRQAVDFDAFAEDGIFLIAGRTGAGKSSVLDGVCYALFGSIPRYDGAERRLRSDHCEPADPTEVALEFTAVGERWRVTRSPEYARPKLRGDGNTTEPHRAALERLDGERWVGVAARPVDVAATLDEIVGLTQQQFLQVILLAQNRFARFLLARNDERQALLRTLFGTRTYEQYEQLLEERRKQAESALSTEGDTARMLLDEGERVAIDADLLGGASGEIEVTIGEGADAGTAQAPREHRARLADLVRAAERAAYRVEAAALERAAADAALDTALARQSELATLHERQVRRVEARAALSALDAEQDAVDADRDRLVRAFAAETLRPVFDAAERASVAAARAEEQEASAREAWIALGETAAPGVALRAREDELAGDLARAEATRASEVQLAAAVAEQTDAEHAALAADAAIAALDTQRSAVPALLAGLGEKLSALAPAPAALAAAEQRRAELTERLAAARDAARLAARRDDADRAAVAAATMLVETTAAHTVLLQRRLASAAGDLARELTDGAECPVCGAVEHPRPAHPTGEPVTDAAIDAAAAAKDAALSADRLAAEAARAARDTHAEAAARAGGQDEATLDLALAEAVAAVDAALGDLAATERLTRERDELTAIDAEAAAGREALVAEATTARQTAALAAQRAGDLRALVVEGRGSFDTVAARCADLERRRAVLRALDDAAAERALRAQIAADAAADRDARLADSIFDDGEAARAALLPETERRRLDERVAAHDAAHRAHKQALLDLELALIDATEDPVDLDPIRAEVSATRERVTASASAHATAGSLAVRLRDLAERADAAHRGIAALAETAEVIGRLANTVAGRAPNTHRMTLETFVLAAELEEIVNAANIRLDEMSAGRYRLQHTDALAARGAASGLGLAVLDAFTGQARPPQSLSGGETFLASLALALGLAEVVTARAGGMRLDTLFIDEGFGSLDDETLELAMRALDELRQGGRTVGVISHVAAMKEQLPAQLRVEATPSGPSILRQDVTVGA